MAGVEAAASLFGSEDSASDLFATLGANSSPVPPPPPEADLFFNTTSSHPEAGVSDNVHEGQHAYEHSTYSAAGQIGVANAQHANASEEWNASTNSLSETYPANVTSTNFGDPPSSSPYEAYNYHNNGAQQPQPFNSAGAYSNYGYPTSTTTYSSYSAYDPPPMKTLPTRSVYDTYTPPAPQSSYQPNEPFTAQVPHGTAYSAYGNSTTTGGPYDPPGASQIASHGQQYGQSHGESHQQAANNSNLQAQSSTYDPHVQPPRNTTEMSAGAYSSSLYSPPPVVSSSGIVQPNTLTSPPPAPIKSTINRPKISNAYDPPFPTIGARRPTRSAVPQQFQSQYQTPLEHETKPPPQIPPPRSTMSYIPYSGEEFIPPATIGPDRSKVLTPPNAIHLNERSPVAASFPPQTSEWPTEETVQELSKTISSNSNSDDSILGNAEQRVGTTPRSRPASTKPLSPPRPIRELSPTLIPLPDSPSPEHKSYPPKKPSSPAPKTSLEIEPKRSIPSHDAKYDPYAPKISHNMHNNYIPRTSSPLSLSNGHGLDIQKPAGPPPRSNLNNSNPAPIPKPLNPASFHSTYALEQDVSRQAEFKLVPSDNPNRHFAAQYAPSPSLIGANDPLSRTSARAPAISFGFGGKLITCFHGMPGLNAGFDVAFSSRTSSELKIRSISKVIPELSQTSSFPGPLLSDPGTSSISLVRQNAQTQAKTKKASVLSYLSDRITEVEQGVGYLGSAEKQSAEDKLVLIKLLKVMVESDGRLLGSPQAETAVRAALVPRIDVGSSVLQDAVALQATYPSPSLDDTPVTVTTLRSSSLDKIEELLLQGDRRQAYQYAMSEKLWAHAMIIASSIDKDAWKEVTHDFLRTELGTREDASPNLAKSNAMAVPSQPHSRESLRVAYSLFSGSGASAVQELVSQSLLQRTLGRMPPPVALPATTPRTPNFAALPPNNMYPPVPPELLNKWADTAAMIISSPLSTDYAAALTALGDQLLVNNFVEAAHVCYVLSPQTSLVGGLGSPTARITLVGTKNPGKAAKDKDSVIFSEIFEFALSLVPTVKGQEAFYGLAQLQTYRFVRAMEIAEQGDLQLANRYCDAIATCLSHAPSFGNLVLLEQLQGLQQRLSGVFHGDKSNSWIGGKISKPSLDSIGGWLEGRFTKLVTGDSEEDAATNNAKPSDQPFDGPFAHYSTISSTTPSARSSPQPPSAGVTHPPPQRTASAMSNASPYMPQYQAERSSSAMGYARQRPPVQTTASAAQASPLPASQSSSVGFGAVNQYDPHSRQTSIDDELETPIQGSSWWQQSEASVATPTNATFMKVDESSISQSDDGFISLMDSNSYSVGPSTPVSMTSRYTQDDDEEDDLGLGNSKPKPPKAETETGEGADQESDKAVKPASDKPASAPAPAAAASGGSWFGRWFKRGEAAPGPIKASLGDDNGFYYDAEQKRWINKNAATEPPKPAAPPPPPSRTQSASPGMTGAKPPTASTPPPLRSASAVDLGGEPPKAPMRIRSNLAPPIPVESAPSTPTGSRLNPGAPPPARPRSQAAKRNIRSRYVDVLQDGPA